MAIPIPQSRCLWLLDRHRPTSEAIASDVRSAVPDLTVEIFTSAAAAEQAFSSAQADTLPTVFGTDLVGVSPLRGEGSPTVAGAIRSESPLTTIALFSGSAYNVAGDPRLVDRLYKEQVIDIDVPKPNRPAFREIILHCLLSWDAPELVYLRDEILALDDPWVPVIPNGAGRYLNLIEVYRQLSWGGPAADALRPAWRRLATSRSFEEAFPEADA